ncbi:MAG: hypothetical protein FWB88_08910 [Defluviitaleaceae bacterium]|nr:hypothetical protein [Defluviitaleaceae bacterium]MCL2239527.1 hypothetical protein [Defluviitaleaceae bacterium]
MDCPYYNDLGHERKLYGTKQTDYQRQTYCMSRDKWRECANLKEAKKTNNPKLYER